MIFVTGGTGLVGSYLLLKLADRGEKIIALKRKNSDIRKVEQFFRVNKSQEIFHKIQWIEGDILDIPFLQDALTGVKTVIHTAAFVSFNEKDEDKIIQTNVDGTEALINESILSGVENFIYVSSIAAMDDFNPATKLIDESSTWNTEINHSAYAYSKFRAEMEVWKGSQEGLNVIVLNPSVIIGSFDGKRESERIFHDNFINEFSPNGGTGFVDVRDVVSLLLKAYDLKLYNQKFIVNAENRSYYSILSRIKNKQHKKVTKISNRVLKLIQIASQFTKFFGGQKINNGTYKALTTFTAYDNSKSIATFNHQYYSVNEAIDYHYKNYQSIISTK